MKRVLSRPEIQIWAGAWSEAQDASPDVYIAINGDALPRVVEDHGLGAPTIGPVGVVIRWPARGLPPLDRSFWEGLSRRVLERGGRLYVGDPSGVNPTGVVLAILGYHMGATKTPVAWVREVFSPLAVATDEEARYVAEMTGVDEGAGGSLMAEPATIVMVGEGDSELVNTVRLAMALVAREEGAEDVIRALEISDYNGSIWISGCGGELAIDRDSMGWEITLWGGSPKTSRSYFIAQDPVVREFIRKERAIHTLLAKLDLDGDGLIGDYDDIFGLSLGEDGRFTTPEGMELDPEDAAAYILGKVWD